MIHLGTEANNGHRKSLQKQNRCHTHKVRERHHRHLRRYSRAIALRTKPDLASFFVSGYHPSKPEVLDETVRGKQGNFRQKARGGRDEEERTAVSHSLVIANYEQLCSNQWN